ncbi:MAG: SpoIVB peptidase [Clostridia bacterium]|nr:SpoIVB peptidase [Clostridia bacterium]
MNLKDIADRFNSKKFFKRKLVVFLIVCFLVMFVSYLRTVFVVPGEVTLLEGEEYVYDFKSPFLVSVKADKLGVVKLNNGEVGKSGSYFRLSNPLMLKPQKNGTVSLSMRVFGLIPLRTIKVDVVPNKRIVACGNTVGVKLKINGILVIGISDVETEDGKRVLPVRQSGIKTGDLITAVNDANVTCIDDLVREIDKSQGNKVKVKFRRGDIYEDVLITPVKSVDDKKYHIGLWVRESTAGIGTLTFYDPETNSFGALGHGITDIDTGTLMPIRSGEILESRILAVRKGKSGNPGELRGVFIEDKNTLGVINDNSEYGIYGKFNEESLDRISRRLYPIGIRSQIREGPAMIFSNISGKKVDEYSIEILKVSRQNSEGSKGMIIKVTDKRLIDATGGIVQGMSGSPIIQDGKIVGAVTHVLVNDPTRGYGIFIERMIKNIQIQQSGEIKRVS